MGHPGKDASEVEELLHLITEHRVAKNEHPGWHIPDAVDEILWARADYIEARRMMRARIVD
jgi:hypothetical protein